MCVSIRLFKSFSTWKAMVADERLLQTVVTASKSRSRVSILNRSILPYFLKWRSVTGIKISIKKSLKDEKQKYAVKHLEKYFAEVCSRAKS